QPVAAPGEPREEAVRWPVGEVMASFDAFAQVDRVEEAVGGLGHEAGREQGDELQLDPGDSRLRDVEGLHPDGRVELVGDELAVARTGRDQRGGDAATSAASAWVGRPGRLGP